MKTTTKTLAFLALLSGMSQAAITISGTVGTAYKTQDGATNLPVGSLWMVVADTGTSGFITDGIEGSAFSAGTSGLTTTVDPKLLAASASITAGQSFGGDTIIATGATTTAGVVSSLLTSKAIAGFENKNFALVWFGKSSATLGSEGLANQYYGIMRLADWTFPATDSGTFTMSSTDASGASSFFSTSSALSNAQLGGTGFFTGSGTAGDVTNDIKGTTFQIVPEPSAALLGALGALGLLRRRRN
jgi:hypothetical protein